MNRATVVKHRNDALRRLWRIMELNADIDRNQSDSAFAHSGGLIHYVFDENIFEMFVRPYERADYVSAFYSRARTPPIGSQSALVTAEYLLSGQLPGQQGRPIYMTEWHFWELRDQVEQRRQELRDAVENPAGTGSIDEFLTKIEEIARMQTDEAAESLDRLLEDNLETKRDVAGLRRRQIPEDVIRRFVVARLAAQLMALDELVEPLQQLARIFSSEIAPRLRPLQLDFPLQSASRQELVEDAKSWFNRLTKEQQLQAARYSNKSREKRRRGSLQNDARSLAYVLWAVHFFARRNERFVFVTGDRLLFDAYRRWHVLQPPGEPFVLRRILQFAPFLNLNDTPNDIGNARELFVRTREAVEVPLIAFNLMQSQQVVQGNGASPHAARAREHVLLLLAGLGDLSDDPRISFFTQRIEPAWFSNHSDEFRRLRTGWQEIERISIGANYQLVARRFDTAQRRRADAAADRGAVGARDAFITYLRQLLDEIVRNSVKLWFPLAVGFIRGSDPPANSLAEGLRVPIALRLSVPVPAVGVGGMQTIQRREIGEMLESWHTGDLNTARIFDLAQNPALSERHHLVFAIAAALALRLALWSQAGRYSDLASSAAEIGATIAGRNSVSREDASECLYLKALATRFRIGSFEPDRSAVTANVWRRWLFTAIADLDRCQAFHRAPAPDEHHRLRELRAVSERAAVRLFYSAWAVSTIEMPDLAFFSAKEGFDELQAAIADLRLCLQLAPGARSSADGDEQRKTFFSRLERQVVTNCAAAEVIADLFERDFEFGSASSLVDEGGWVIKCLREWAEVNPVHNLSTVAKIDIFAFLAFRENNHGAIRHLRGLEANKSSWPTLAIDRTLFRTIVNHLPQD